MRSNTHRFPGPFVFSANVESHPDVKEWLMPVIQKKVEEDEEGTLNLRDNHFANVISSYGKPPRSIPELIDNTLLSQILWGPMDHMLEENPSVRRPLTSSVGNAWFNYFTESDWHAPHVHRLSSFSAIYLLHLEEQNPTVFCNQLSLHSPLENPFYTTEHLEEGSIIIFPSDLMHYVPPTKSSKRVTLSYNITSTFG